jgi:hypothetical protein
MKRLILLTTFAAALVPATASAWPGRPSDPPWAGDPPPTEPGWRPERDRGYDTYDTRYDRGFRERWITLSAFTPARKGRETVHLDRGERKIDRVRISAVRGAPVVRQVIIQYGNGQYERRPVNDQLRPGKDAIISIDTNRRVQKIMVLTDPRSGGAYSLYGAG